MDTEQVIEAADVDSETYVDAENERIMPTAKVECRKAISIGNNAEIELHGSETVEKKVESINVVEDQSSNDVRIKTTTVSSINTEGYTCSMCDCWYLLFT